MTFPRKFFGSVAAHNRLLMWPRFYRAFGDYEYILMYHLDSLVFSDDLMRWCEAGWDYIGAPWIPCADTPWVKEAAVGNGGFALMKITSVLRVLTNRHRRQPTTFLIDLILRNGNQLGVVFRVLEWWRRILPNARVPRAVLQHWHRSENPSRYGGNNDHFWAYQAARYLPAFKVATVEAGLSFAFEAAPRTCFEMNGCQLPFGCHAWQKFDAQFWEPYLLPAAQGLLPAGQRHRAAL